jgi:hypothetical protein
MGDRIPGVVGMDPFAKPDDSRDPGESPAAGFTDLGPNGTDPVPMTDRIIAKVDDDWHPPAPNTSPTVVLKGKTLEAVGKELDALDEWGKGGGSLRTDTIPAGNSTNLTVKLHGNLQFRLPSWPNYSSASDAVKKEWDRMMAKLRAHEQRHIDIAIEYGDDLAKDLVGNDIGAIAKMVTARNRQMAADQQQLDTDTDHGAKPGVKYGDVFLDTTIT